MKAIFFIFLIVVAALVAAGCDVFDTNTNGDPEQVCDPNDPEGPPCVQLVETNADFDAISLKVGSFPHPQRITKYMVPTAKDPELLPALFQNANRYPLHLEFLAAVFPDRFPDFTMQEYMNLILSRKTRKYYTGNFMRFNDPVEGEFYGFTVYTASSSVEILEAAEVRDIYRMISEVFFAGRLAYTFEPSDAMSPMKARTWIDPGFPIYFPNQGGVRVEVYTPAVGYGRIRRYSLEEFEAAIRRGELGWQDIVVVDRVPFDIETVVAGVVTGGRQWELSHVNVRMARRGTPNLYVKDAVIKLEEFDGKLVRLEASKSTSTGVDDSYTVREADWEEAEAWWLEHRPSIDEVPEVDRDYHGLDDLLDMDTDDDPVPLISRFGGKASNLAKLYEFIPPGYQVPGFAIPFAYFEEFMENNTLVDRRVEPPDEVCYREYVTRLVADERFNTDTPYRRQLLWDLRIRMREQGQVEPELIKELAQRIEEVFGETGVKVRFRSSSNVEDALQFSGAGLYSSTSVCAKDSLDSDRDGPSHCDPGQDEERSIERGLRRVWASLYNTRAWEEREWYQIPQEKASMAILVTLAFSDEKANGVAFTGNPAESDDDKYLINAQLGDEAVVGNDPKIVPEMVFLEIDSEKGEVKRIDRKRTSVLCEPGSYVLSNEQLEELGRLMFRIDRQYPLDTEGYPREQVLLDMEFKLDREGALRIKQIRPFLRPTAEGE